MNANFRTYHLSVELYRECTKLKLPHHLKDQLLRASSSVALNLAEGRGKRTPKDQRRFFDIAFGSIRETQSILDLANTQGNIVLLADKAAAHLYKLIQFLS
ncbi:MAG: four helix bundle protein [Pseudomonadota bacterium]